MNEAKQIITEEFIKDLCVNTSMNCGQIFDKCEDMGYDTTLDKIVSIMQVNPYRITPNMNKFI